MIFELVLIYVESHWGGIKGRSVAMVSHEESSQWDVQGRRTAPECFDLLRFHDLQKILTALGVDAGFLATLRNRVSCPHTVNEATGPFIPKGPKERLPEPLGSKLEISKPPVKHPWQICWMNVGSISGHC